MSGRTYSTHDAPLAPMSPTLVRVATYWFVDLPLDFDEMELPRPVGLLVGEQPRPGGNPKLPLWPWPKNSAGGRLFAMSGMTLLDYLTKLARVNVSREPVARWNDDWARRRMLSILRGLPDGARVVLCGARARDAAGVDEWFEEHVFTDSQMAGVVRIVAIPHPSGRTREYNSPGVREEAGKWIRWAAGG